MTGVKDSFGINTQLVHAGERSPTPQGKPVSTPVYATTTFTYDSMAEMDQVFAGEKQGYVYTRYGNPTISALEQALNVLEQGKAACAYSTGMAALHAAIFACELGPGASILASQDL
jgi:O-acetylhomoserine/O-acetylserine sulfhydrylase-like pyridoxal-dependent enzyme